MRISVTGGTGFVGGHLATRLSELGHDVVVLARGVDHRPWAQEVLERPGITVVQIATHDAAGLVGAFERSDAVAHRAGINREIGSQTYEAVHSRGAVNVVSAVEAADVRRMVFISLLRARPGCGLPYTSQSGLRRNSSAPRAASGRS